MSDPADTPDWTAFEERARELGVALSPKQLAQFARYLALLREWNQRFNLTAIERPDEVLVKHFLDSLSCVQLVDFHQVETLADVGTGAGFPGLALKVAFPHMRVTLLDAVQKRLGFLERVAADLGLQHVQTVHARAEDAGALKPVAAAPRLRERFDLVTARAVARMNVLAEWVLPLTRVGGAALLMKGPEVAAEVAEARPAIRLLGGGEAEALELTLPGTELGRSLVRVPKVSPTPTAYPRRPGSARKAPL